MVTVLVCVRCFLLILGNISSSICVTTCCCFCVVFDQQCCWKRLIVSTAGSSWFTYCDPWRLYSDYHASLKGNSTTWARRIHFIPFPCDSFRTLCAFPSLQYSLCNEPLIELSNPGASGSVFYLTKDDEFIIKTVMHKEAEFLQKLLPGYYMVSVCDSWKLNAKSN